MHQGVRGPGDRPVPPVNLFIEHRGDMKTLVGINLTVLFIIGSILAPDVLAPFLTLGAAFSGVWLGTLLARACGTETDGIRHDAVLLSAEVLLLVLKWLFPRSG